MSKRIEPASISDAGFFYSGISVITSSTSATFKFCPLCVAWIDNFNALEEVKILFAKNQN
jgi:hypothetical protein